MKRIYVFLLAAALMTLFAVNACVEKAPVIMDPVITVDNESFQAGPEMQIVKVSVSSNCNWVVMKEDYEGNAAQWIQTDMQKGGGNVILGIRVLENRDTEKRMGQVVLKADGAKAFIDVVQAGADPKPEPEPGPGPGPDPEPGNVLSFDFTVAGLGWPLTKNDSWSGLTNLDSGLALDNGGTATSNVHRRGQVSYPVGGGNYLFTFADPDAAPSHNIYLSDGKGVYSGTRRQFGLPAIAGKKLVKVEMVQGASDKDPATFKRNVGLTEEVYAIDKPVDEFVYITGGEPQNQYTNMGEYTYELTGTKANTVYYLSSPTNASIIVSLKLTYEDASSPDPGPGPGPGPDPEPAEKNLEFSFAGDPQPGWPTEPGWAADAGSHKLCTYTMAGGETYELDLVEPSFANGGKIYWAADKQALHFGKYRYVSLPVISGYALQTVVCTVAVQISGSAVAIMDHVFNNSSISDPDSYAVPAQAWNVAVGTEMTYDVNSSDPDKQYYLYCKNPSGGEYIGKVTLKYAKVK